MKLTKAMAEKIFSAKDYEEAKKQAAEIGYEMSAEEDAELKKYFTHELSDEELDQVAGGYDEYKCVIRQESVPGRWTGISVPVSLVQKYVWKGSDEDQKYLCRHCGRPVHKGTFGRFYCDPCDESWFIEAGLMPNLDNWTKDGDPEWKSR